MKLNFPTAKSKFFLCNFTWLSNSKIRTLNEVHNWRASVASETLTGVKMKKSGMFVYWRASEASETVLRVDNAKSGKCYMYVWMVRMLLKRARGTFFS